MTGYEMFCRSAERVMERTDKELNINPEVRQFFKSLMSDGKMFNDFMVMLDSILLTDYRVATIHLTTLLKGLNSMEKREKNTKKEDVSEINEEVDRLQKRLLRGKKFIEC